MEGAAHVPSHTRRQRPGRRNDWRWRRSNATSAHVSHAAGRVDGMQEWASADRFPSGTPQELAQRVRARARELGFDRVGFADATTPLVEDFDRYAELVARGWHGAMSYLGRQPELRRSVARPELVAGARTVICLGWGYRRHPHEDAADPPLARRIARYARGRDYHGFLRRRIDQLAAFVRGLASGTLARAFCDTGPVLERAWAARAGIGFVGRNHMLIAPGLGSYLLLGEVVTTLTLPADEPHAEEPCGDCRACIVACPTAALVAPGMLDPRRCVAYVTTELREAVPPELREAVSERLFGCDRCQEVCPHNGPSAADPLDPGPARPLARWGRVRVEELVTLEDERWRVLARGTALRRVPAWAMARNAQLLAARLATEAAAGAPRAHSPPGRDDREIGQGGGSEVGAGAVRSLY
jgi:epoxyqueuosine reductase